MFTFSKMGQHASSAKTPVRTVEDLIQKIEACRNFSKEYSSEQSPAADISSGKIDSVIFKLSEEMDYREYHFWVKTGGGHTHYLLTISNKTKDLDTIVDASGYTLPCSSFRINDENMAEIVYYGAPRR